MKQDETPIAAGPNGDYVDVLVAALNEEGIPARLIAIENVDLADRPVWACTPGEEVYAVIPSERREAALELVRWVSRVCLNCETVLLPKVQACQECRTPHLMHPGPNNFVKGPVVPE